MFLASLVAQTAKNFPARQRLNFYPWIGKIPWREQPGGLQSMGLQRVRHDCTTNTNTPTNTRNVSGTQDFISKSAVLGCRLLNMENPLSKPERLRKGKLGFAVILPGLYLSWGMKRFGLLLIILSYN